MAYIYYSYEEFGRGYIGFRDRSPENDEHYMGSFSDSSFKPTNKIVLATFAEAHEALAAEVELHAFFKVAENPHFANRARQTSTGFSTAGWAMPQEVKDKIGDAQRGKEVSEETRRLMSENNYSRTEEAKARKRGDGNPMRRPEVAEKCKGNKSRTGMTNTPESNAKRSAALKGRKKSPETRERMRQAALRRKKRA